MSNYLLHIGIATIVVLVGFILIFGSLRILFESKLISRKYDAIIFIAWICGGMIAAFGIVQIAKETSLLHRNVKSSEADPAHFPPEVVE